MPCVQPDWHHNKLEFRIKFNRCYDKVIWIEPWNKNLTCYGFQGLSRFTTAVVPICDTETTFCVKVNYRHVAQYTAPFHQQPLKHSLSNKKEFHLGSFRLRNILYDMIYLLTAIGLSPGGSNTVHIYTQTVNRTTQKKTIHRTTQKNNT
jgi:hypothetical protein